MFCRNEQRICIYDKADLTFDEALSHESFERLLRMKDEKLIKLFVFFFNNLINFFFFSLKIIIYLLLLLNK